MKRTKFLSVLHADSQTVKCGGCSGEGKEISQKLVGQGATTI